MASASKDVNKRRQSSLEHTGAPLSGKKSDEPNPVWFKPVMFGFMLLGLVWIVLYYVTSTTATPLPIPAFEQTNIFIGFGFVLIGFLMTPWWK